MFCTLRAVILFSATLSVASLSAFPQVAQQTAADSLFAGGHYLRAEIAAKKDLQQDPNNVHYLVRASAVEWAFDRQDSSIALAQKAVILNGNSAEAQAQLTNALGAKLAISTVGMMEKVGLARRFKQASERALQLNPNNPDTLEDVAQFCWNAPGFAGGDRSKAHQYADRLFAVDPARGAALKSYFIAAEIKDVPRRLTATEGVWRVAAAARPASYEVHIGLAESLLAESAAGYDPATHYAQAEAEAKSALALSVTRIPAYRTLAVIYASLHRWNDLDVLLKRSAAAVPDNLAPAYQAARILLTQGDPAQMPRAAEYLRIYIAQPTEGQEPTSAAAHWSLALVLEKQNRRPDAIHELQLAVSLDPAFDPARRELKRLS